jgi:ketosteroid isomerase-like protein
MDTADLGTRMVDAHNAGDDQALLAIYAQDATVHFAGWAAPVDARSWVAAQVGIRESLPDLRFEIRTVSTGTGVAVVELTMTGTNSGVLHLSDDDRIVLRTDAQSLPPTGGRISIDGVVVLEMSDGLVTAERHYWPTVQSLVQLGLVRPRDPVAELADVAG